MVFANFVFLPALFLVLRAAARFLGGPRLTLVEFTFLTATLAVFLLNNLAPPYPGWQMRGTWIARLYQPVFVVFLWYSLRFAHWGLQQAPRIRRVTTGILGLTALGNSLIVFGPVLPVRTLSRFSDRIYSAFYAHSPPGSFLANIERHGRRPVGICRAAAERHADP